MISPGLGSKNSWGPERCTVPNSRGRSADAEHRAAGGTCGGAAGDGVYFEVEDDGGRGGTACVLRTIDDLQ